MTLTILYQHFKIVDVTLSQHNLKKYVDITSTRIY